MSKYPQLQKNKDFSRIMTADLASHIINAAIGRISSEEIGVVAGYLGSLDNCRRIRELVLIMSKDADSSLSMNGKVLLFIKCNIKRHVWNQITRHLSSAQLENLERYLGVPCEYAS